MDFTITLAAARVNANLTQQELGSKLGVDRSTIMAWEQGKRIPNAKQLKTLCEICNIPQQYIFLP